MIKTQDDKTRVMATLTVHDWENFTKRERERFFLWIRNQVVALSDYDQKFSKRYTARLHGKVK